MRNCRYLFYHLFEISMDLLSIILSIVICLCLLGGTVNLVLIWKLKRLFNIKYIVTYQLYLYFLLAFGLYGIIGSIAVQRLLENYEVSFRATTLASHFFIFLGLPFMILAWFQFIRMCYELVHKTFKRKANIIFFIIQFLLFIIYGSALVYSSLYDPEYLSLISYYFLFYLIAVDVACRAFGLCILWIYGCKLSLKEEKQNVHRLSLMFLLLFIIQTMLFSFFEYHDYVAGIYLLVFFSGNIPILLYLHIHLSKHYHPTLTGSKSEALQHVYESVGLTRREKEIVALISQGKSNQQIADSLFITLQTVKDHNHRIYSKLGVSSRSQVINIIREYDE